MRIYLRLAELARAQRGWTLRRLSDELQVDYQNIVNWNTGRSSPHLHMLVEISRILRCTLDDLIGKHQQEAKPLEKPSATLPSPSSITPYPKRKGPSPKASINPKRYSNPF